jgi:hypothetical protein
MTALAVDTRRGLEWQEDASCARDMHFSDRPFSEQLPVCRQCTVRFECLELGLSEATLKESDTVSYGGMSAAELSRMSRTRRGLPPAPTRNERRGSRPVVAPKPRPPSKRKVTSAVCVGCGADFEARSRIALYCSALCRQRAYKDNLNRRADEALAKHRAES